MLTLQEITAKMSKLNDWVLEDNTIIKQIEFHDFKSAIDYANKVAEIASAHNHHPDILISYNTVRLTLTTHQAGELTEIDFKVAEDIDKI